MVAGKGMGIETYNHIVKYIHTLELDLINGIILNRNTKFKDNEDSYLQMSLSGKKVKQHQIFAVARWGSKCLGMTVNHINEMKIDNSWNNLELRTTEKNISIASKGGKPKQPIKAIHLDTSEELIFESQHEASRQLGLKQQSIHNVLNGKQKHTGRYTFKRMS